IGAALWLSALVRAGKRDLAFGHADLIAELAAVMQLRGDVNGAFRLGIHGVAAVSHPDQSQTKSWIPVAELAALTSVSALSRVYSIGVGMAPSAAFSPDGGHFVAASKDGVVHICETESGKVIIELKLAAGDLIRASYSPDGTRIAIGLPDGTARII